MPTSREKRVAKEVGTAIPSRHEWAGLLYRKGTVTREGKFKTWQEARRWVVFHLRTEKHGQDLYTDITMATVCHVERVGNKVEDVEVGRFLPQYGTWTEQWRKKPWFQGHYQ
jgi:hypothetical protein